MQRLRGAKYRPAAASILGYSPNLQRGGDTACHISSAPAIFRRRTFHSERTRRTASTSAIIMASVSAMSGANQNALSPPSVQSMYAAGT